MSLVLIVVLVFFVLAGALGAVAYFTYQKKLRRAKAIERGLKMVPILIHLPPPSSDTQGGSRDLREVMREKTSQAEVLYNLIAGTATEGFKSKFYGQRHIALELIVTEGLVHFYAAVPVALTSVVKKAVLTAYPGARMEEVEDHNIFNQEGRLAATLGGEMVLRTDNGYPIATYDQLERDPMEALLTTISALQKQDGVAIQIMLRPANPAWTKRAIKLAEGLRKGKHSQGTFTAMDLAKAAVKAPEQKREEERHKNGGAADVSQLQLSQVERMEEKTKHPGFEVLVRVLVSTGSVIRSQELLRDISTTFALFESPGLNGFKFLPALDVQGLVTAFIFRFFPNELTSNVLNSAELATLFHLPDSQFTPSASVEREQSKQVDGPVQLPVTGLLFGYNEFRGVKKEIRLSNEDRRRHTYILGQTGTGKSTMLENLAVQDMQNGNGFAFIDPHGDSAEKLLALVPKERSEDVIYFNPADSQYPLGLNLFEFSDPAQKDFIVQETINMLYKLYDPGHTGIIGPRYEHWYRNAALTLMSDPNGSTFIEIPKVFTDTDYLKQKFKYLKDPTVIDFWTKEMGQTSDYHKSEMLGWFVSKFGAFQNNEIMRNIIGQTKSSFNIRDIMDNKKILIVNLSKGQIGELNSQLLGMIFVIKFQAAAMSRANVPEEQRADFALYVDEFQNFSTDSFASILSEARKYRLNLIVANQFIGQLSQEIRDAVFGNIGTIVAHRMGPDDAEFMVKQFAPVFDASDLVNIPNFRAAMRLMIGGLPSQPFSINDSAPLGTPNAEMGLAIKQLSAAKFGRDKAQVEADLLDRLSGRPAATTPPATAAPVVEPAAVGAAVPTASVEPVAAAAAPAPSVAAPVSANAVPSAPVIEPMPTPAAVAAPVSAQPLPPALVAAAPVPTAVVPTLASAVPVPDPLAALALTQEPPAAPVSAATLANTPPPIGAPPIGAPPIGAALAAIDAQPAALPGQQAAPVPAPAAPTTSVSGLDDLAAQLAASADQVTAGAAESEQPVSAAAAPPPIGAPPIDLPPIAAAPGEPARPDTLSLNDITGGRKSTAPEPAAEPSALDDVPLLGEASDPAVQAADGRPLPNDPYANIDILGEAPPTLAQAAGGDGASPSAAPIVNDGQALPGDPYAQIDILGVPVAPTPVIAPAAITAPAPAVEAAALEPEIIPETVPEPAAPVAAAALEPVPEEQAPAPLVSELAAAAAAPAPLPEPEPAPAPTPEEVPVPVAVPAPEVAVAAPEPALVQAQQPVEPPAAASPTLPPEPTPAVPDWSNAPDSASAREAAEVPAAEPAAAPVEPAPAEPMIHFVDPAAQTLLETPDAPPIEAPKDEAAPSLSGLPAGIALVEPTPVEPAAAVPEPTPTPEPVVAPAPPPISEPVPPVIPVPTLEPAPAPIVAAPVEPTTPTPVVPAPAVPPAAAVEAPASLDSLVSVADALPDSMVPEEVAPHDTPTEPASSPKEAAEVKEEAVEVKPEPVAAAVQPVSTETPNELQKKDETQVIEEPKPEPAPNAEPEKTVIDAVLEARQEELAKLVAETKPEVIEPKPMVDETPVAAQHTGDKPEEAKPVDKATEEVKPTVETVPAEPAAAPLPVISTEPVAVAEPAPAAETKPQLSEAEQIKQSEHEIDDLLSVSLIKSDNTSSHRRLPEPVVEQTPTDDEIDTAGKPDDEAARHADEAKQPAMHHGIKVIEPLEPIVPSKEKFAAELAALQAETAAKPAVPPKPTPQPPAPISAPPVPKPSTVSKPNLAPPAAPVPPPTPSVQPPAPPAPSPAKPAEVASTPQAPVAAVVKPAPAGAMQSAPPDAEELSEKLPQPPPPAAIVKHEAHMAQPTEPDVELPPAQSLEAGDVATFKQAQASAAEAQPQPESKPVGKPAQTPATKPQDGREGASKRRHRNRMGNKPAEVVSSPEEAAHNQPSVGGTELGAMTGRLILPTIEKEAPVLESIEATKPKKLQPGEVYVDAAGNVIIGE